MATPLARKSASTASMPFLSIVRSPALVRRNRTQRFSDSTQKRRYCKFGKKRRLVLLLAWETFVAHHRGFPGYLANACHKTPH